MEQLRTEIGSLPITMVGGINHLSYQAVTNQVAAFLLPGVSADEIGGADYQHILETSDTLCRELGYTQVVKLTPPDVPLNQMGLYWSKERPGESGSDVIVAGPGRADVRAGNPGLYGENQLRAEALPPFHDADLGR